MPNVPVDDTAYDARVAERKANNVPLPYDDDEHLENNVAFAVFLSAEQQAEVRQTREVLDKRRLIAKYSRAFATNGSDA